jgi:hypothetical protein
VFHIGIDIDGTATDCVLIDQAAPDAAVTYQQDGSPQFGCPRIDGAVSAWSRSAQSV